jgi:hypothetical protein
VAWITPPELRRSVPAAGEELVHSPGTVLIRPNSGYVTGVR